MADCVPQEPIILHDYCGARKDKDVIDLIALRSLLQCELNSFRLNICNPGCGEPTVYTLLLALLHSIAMQVCHACRPLILHGSHSSLLRASEVHDI